MTLSKAGRFASGWSPGPDGEDGSSRGRFWDGIAEVVGEADMIPIVDSLDYANPIKCAFRIAKRR
jgi:hypothetical protein